MKAIPNSTTPFPGRVARYTFLLVRLFQGVFTVAFLFPFYNRRRRWRAVQSWSQAIVRSAGVRVTVSGATPQSGERVMGVANHVSWLDIQVLHSVWHVRFVAKAEVRQWPFIGWLSARTGTLFVERANRRHAAHINQAIHMAFAEGDAVAVFPEGSTTWGDEVRRFHASLLQPAVDEAATVVPVAIRYTDAAGNISKAAAYADDMSLMQSISNIVRQRIIHAHVMFLEKIEASDKTRRELARLSHVAVASALNFPTADS